MSKPDPYEIAIYSEDVDQLAAHIRKIVRLHTDEIKDNRIRIAIIASALGTVAQNIDEVKFKEDGVTGRLASCVGEWSK